MTREPINLHHLMNKVIRERLDALSTQTFDELSQLPSHSSEDVAMEENTFVVSIWHDVLSSQEHRVVVQVYKPGILGIGHMQADGFVINIQSEKRPLALQEWAPFS